MIKGKQNSEVVIMNKSYNFYMGADLSSHIGEWIAICEDKIVSHGDNAKKVFEKAERLCDNKRILLTKVPEKETMIF
ncbi:MAG: DUF5678 domain-containing protein [Candidatus Altiarchaeota archaeon]